MLLREKAMAIFGDYCKAVCCYVLAGPKYCVKLSSLALSKCLKVCKLGDICLAYDPEMNRKEIELLCRYRCKYIV